MKKFKDIIWVTFGIAVLLYVMSKIAINSFTDHFMGNNPQLIKAVIINNKNYMGNQPVNPKFSYSYQFTVRGELYTGNSHDTTLQVGDSVEVIYNRHYPNINRALNPQN